MADIHDYPSSVIKMNFSEVEQQLFIRHSLTDGELNELHRKRIEAYGLSGKIERAGLDLSPSELE